MKKLLWLIFILALFLRLYRVGVPVLKEDEFTAVKAAAYVYYCQIDANQCRHDPTGFRERFLALVSANETRPNPFAEVYLWDFVKEQASETHHSRAWPHLYLAAGIYRILGINEFSSRLISVVAGAFVVFAGYWLSRTLGSSIKQSLIYSFLLAISFPLIDFSRNARFYSLYVLAFMILTVLIYRRRWFLASAVFFLSYQLQMLTLILPVAVLVWAVWTRRQGVVLFLLAGLTLTASLNFYLGVDFFGRQFLTFAWPPHWQYLNWWGILALAVLALKRQKYLLSIVGVYLVALVFFSRPAPAAAYTIALWPLMLWPLINWKRWLAGTITLLMLVNFASKFNYLYFGADNRAQVKSAYAAITDNFKPGDKIYAVQLRDYYLQDLPEDAQMIDLQQNPDSEFSGPGFVVWEKEKAVYIKPETLANIKENFTFLGSGGVEIYSFGK